MEITLLEDAGQLLDPGWRFATFEETRTLSARA
jgi:hypothetical protein